MSNYWWRLRTAGSNYDNSFRFIQGADGLYNGNADNDGGISPAFRIA